MTSKNRVTVLGAGLAGAEAAWQLARRGLSVLLIDQKPEQMSAAHHSPLLAELVCSNSLRSDNLTNAVGLLKEEMRRFGSLTMEVAGLCRVPAGGALAVDRQLFSKTITERLDSHSLIERICQRVDSIPDSPALIATGPLTDGGLSEALASLAGESLAFYDAAAPIVATDSLDREHCFAASRYGEGDDYLNCPLTEEEYHAFVQALIEADTVPLHGFEDGKVFEACMPIEAIARRGVMSLAFGPLKPVGLIDPKTGKRPFAVLQLRFEDAAGRLANLVGCQTRMRFADQERVFGLIPALEHATYERFGVMHRNSFINGPAVLDERFEVKTRPGLFIAGQLTGVEGYVESAASGLLAGMHLARQLKGQPPIHFSSKTALGALGRHVSTAVHNYQPMHIAYGIIDPLPKRIRAKQLRAQMVAERALSEINGLVQEEETSHV